jgi:hypothetical protein
VEDELQIVGCALTQAVCRQPLTLDVRVYSQATSSEICGGENVIGTGFFLNTAVFFLSVSFHNAPHPLIHHIRYII